MIHTIPYGIIWYTIAKGAFIRRLMSPICVNDWIKNGMKILGSEGEAAITIERMSKELGVTKGSFYHHFKNIRDYKQQLLAAWQADTENIISTMRGHPDLPGRLYAFLEQIAKRNPRIETSVRAWGVAEHWVGAYVARVDRARYEVLQEVISRYVPNPQRADAAVYLIYATTLGFLYIQPAPSMKMIKRVLDEFIYLYQYRGDR